MNKTIEIGSDEFGLVVTSAVRYALGRKTYIVGAVIDQIEPMLPYLSLNTLRCLERDIRRAKNLGDKEIDKPEWLGFLSDVQKTLRERVIKKKKKKE